MKGPCANCRGDGVAHYRYSKPGQRYRPPADIEWDGPGRYQKCPACDGTGLRPQRGVRKGWVFFKANGDVDYEKTENYRHEQETK